MWLYLLNKYWNLLSYNTIKELYFFRLPVVNDNQMDLRNEDRKAGITTVLIMRCPNRSSGPPLNGHENYLSAVRGKLLVKNVLYLLYSSILPPCWYYTLLLSKCPQKPKILHTLKLGIIMLEEKLGRVGRWFSVETWQLKYFDSSDCAQCRHKQLTWDILGCLIRLPDM